MNKLITLLKNYRQKYLSQNNLTENDYYPEK
jgi:hypothetical protein